MKNGISKPIVGQLDDAVKSVPGWSPADQLYTLFNLVYMNPMVEGDVIEIGSWCGRSAIALGMAARLTGKSKVHCIDLFPAKSDWHENPDGTFSFKVELGGKTFGGYQEQTVWRDPYLKDIAPLYLKHDSVFQIFEENISNNDLQSIVKPFRGDSSMFVSALPDNFKCKMAFIDGDHSYNAVCTDIKNIEKYLSKGGWVCFDDAFSSYDGVNKAITDCVINSGRYDLCQQMTRKFFVARFKS